MAATSAASTTCTSTTAASTRRPARAPRRGRSRTGSTRSATSVTTASSTETPEASACRGSSTWSPRRATRRRTTPRPVAGRPNRSQVAAGAPILDRAVRHRAGSRPVARRGAAEDHAQGISDATPLAGKRVRLFGTVVARPRRSQAADPEAPAQRQVQDDRHSPAERGTPATSRPTASAARLGQRPCCGLAWPATTSARAGSADGRKLDVHRARVASRVVLTAASCAGAASTCPARRRNSPSGPTCRSSRCRARCSRSRRWRTPRSGSASSASPRSPSSCATPTRPSGPATTSTSATGTPSTSTAASPTGWCSTWSRTPTTSSSPACPSSVQAELGWPPA